MTDIRTLLHDAAPTPAVALDMAAVRARARRTTLRRRVIAVLTGVGAAIGIGVPVGTGLLAPASQSERVGIVGGERIEDHTLGDDERRASDVAALSATTVASILGRSSATTTRSQTPTAPVAYPSAAFCTVNDRDLVAGAQRSCRFTATKRGGASLQSDGSTAPPPGVSPKGEVRVTRGGETSTHEVTNVRAKAGDAEVFAGCSFFIEPGDLVEVVITSSAAGAKDDATVTLGGGEGWAC